jgi:hypothetical protein
VASTAKEQECNYRKNTGMLLEKIKKGEDTTDYFRYCDHTLVDLRDAKIRAEYIRISEDYRAKIMNAKNLEEMILYAVKCIGVMTGDTVFEDSSLKKIKEI